MSNYMFSRVSKYMNVLCLIVFGVWFRGFYFEVVVLGFSLVLHSYKLFLCYVSESL